MRNLKKVIAPAVAGFVLSFLISLVATKGNFGHALLRGLLFAVLFAAVFFLVDFIFNKFLDGSDSSVAPSKKNESGLGDRIDITLSDEELSDDGDDLKFFVGQNKVGLNQGGSDISKASGAAKEDLSNRGSGNGAERSSSISSLDENVPAPSVEKADHSGETVSSTRESSSGSSFRPVPLGTPEKVDSAPAAEAEGSKVSDVDSLPDISDFDSDLGSDESISDSSEGTLDDTDFSGPNKSLYSRKKPGDEVSSGHDAATLAKAIQTILKREE